MSDLSSNGIDGLWSVPDKGVRNAITSERCRQGMLVVVQQDFGSGFNTVWQLKAPPWNGTDSDWIQFIRSSDTNIMGEDLLGTLPNPTAVSTNGPSHIRTTCPHCGCEGKIASNWSGSQRVRCLRCNERFYPEISRVSIQPVETNRRRAAATVRPEQTYENVRHRVRLQPVYGDIRDHPMFDGELDIF